MKRLLALLLTALLLLSNFPAFAATGTERVETWGDWQVVKAPSCTEPGLRTRYSTFENTEQETIRPLGHTPGEWVTVRPASCLQKEYQEMHCSVCYQVMDNRFVGERGEHQWGEWEETISESDTSVLTRQRVCAVCGKTEKEVTVWADLPAMPGAPLDTVSLTITASGETEGVLDAKNGRAKVRITAKNTGNKPLLVTAINPGKNTDRFSGWGAEFINELAPGDEGGFDYTVIVDEADAVVHKSVHREISLGYKYTDDDGASKYGKSNKIILDYSLSGLEDMVTDPPATPAQPEKSDKPETPPAEPKGSSGDASLTLTVSGETEGVLDAKNGRAKVRITAKNTGNKPLLVTAINPGKNTDGYSGWGAEFINELAPGDEGGFDYTVIVDEADAIVHKSVHREISLGYKYTDDDGASKYGKSNEIVLDYTLEGLEDMVTDPQETPTEPDTPPAEPDQGEEPETPSGDPETTPEVPKDMIDMGVGPVGGVHEPYHEGDEVSFEITVFNRGTRALYNVLLYLPDGSYDEIGTIEAGDKAKREFTHTVTHDEAAVYKEFRCDFDACGWPDLKKPPIWAPSHAWILAAADGSEPKKAGLSLTCVSNVPAGAKAGDKVSGLFTLTNTGEVPLTFVDAYLLPYPGCFTDPNANDDMSGWVPYLNQVIDPKDDISATITTVVTVDDAAVGEVVREVYCRCDDPSGERVPSNFANLEGPLTGEDEHGDPNPPEEPEAQEPLTIVKARVGKPMNGSGYQADEMIHYTITVTNVSEQTVYSPAVTDALAGKDAIASRPSLSKDDGPWVISFDYVVRESDFDGGAQVLYNQAWVTYRNVNQLEDKQKSNTVEAPLWYGEENVPDEAQQPEAKDKRECVRTLNLMSGSGAEYTLTLCAEHEALLRETRALIESTESGEARLAALESAAGQWQNEVQALYQLLPEEIGAEGFDALINMLAAGESMLQNCMGRNEAESVQWRLEQLYLRCVDLCYALHHAPDKNRPDSQVTGYFQDILTGLVPVKSELLLKGTESGWFLDIFLCAQDAQVLGTLRRAVAQADDGEALITAFDTAAEAFRGRLAQNARQKTFTLNADVRHAALLWQTYASAYLDCERTLYKALYPETPEIAAELCFRAAMELLAGVQ